MNIEEKLSLDLKESLNLKSQESLICEEQIREIVENSRPSITVADESETSSENNIRTLEARRGAITFRTTALKMRSVVRMNRLIKRKGRSQQNTA